LLAALLTALAASARVLVLALWGRSRFFFLFFFFSWWGRFQRCGKWKSKPFVRHRYKYSSAIAILEEDTSEIFIK
jgi:hypothetical protein